MLVIFAKLDVSVYAHRRFAEADFEAVGYWALVLAYLRHQESEDGFLSSQLIGVPLGAGRERCLPLCEKLVSVGLSRKTDDGYFLVNYAEKNETKDEIEVRKRATRDRKATSRRATSSRVPARGTVTRDHARSARGVSRVTSDSDSDSDSSSLSDSVSGSVSGSDSESPSGSQDREAEREEGGPGGTFRVAVPEASADVTVTPGAPADTIGGRRPLPPSERRLSGHAWLAAFTEGISDATGRPCTTGPMYLRVLERIVEHHAPERAAPRACVWLREQAKAFGQKWDGAHPPKGLTPDGLERWLNEGRQGPPEFGKQRIVQLPPEEWHEDDWSDLGATVLK